MGLSKPVLWTIILLLAVGSRLLTTINYIEDIDSLHFAQSISEFDLAKQQPHFPGYPVFVFIVKVLYLLLGKYSIAFSLIGGLSTTLIIYSLTKMVRNITGNVKVQWGLILLVLLNPMIWLMGNRYMPDLFGCALVTFLLSLFLDLRSMQTGRRFVLFWILAGILCGVRLSYLPIVLLPAIITFISGKKKLLQLLCGLVGVLVWFLPMLMITGWDQLIEIALEHSSGHFAEWGGAITTESSITIRIIGICRSIFADGFGGWWEGRFLINILIGLGLIIPIMTFYKSIAEFVKRRGVLLLVGSSVIYLVWIYLGQNVVYKARHVLPLIPLLILVVGGVWGKLLRFRYGKVLFLLFIFIMGYNTVDLSIEHKKPTSIAQALDWLRSPEYKEADVLIVTIPMIKQYLKRQGVNANYLFYDEVKEHSKKYYFNYDKVITIGGDGIFPERFLTKEMNFEHSGWVNPMWTKITANEYVLN